MLAGHRFAPVAAGGFADYVLRTDDIEAAHAGIAAAGLPTSPVRKVRKSLADGREWEVWLSHFGRGVGDPAMPMLCENRTAHHLRVPSERIEHPNGATGIAGLTIAVPDLAASRARLAAVLPEMPAPGPAAARFAVGAGRVDLAQPDSPDTPEGRRLAAVGPAIVSIAIAGAGGGAAILANDL
jgi:hypothetical protein